MKSFICILLAIIVAVSARATLHLKQDLISDSYIVVLHSNVTAELRSAHIQSLGAAEFTLGFTWNMVLNGYSATMSKAALNSVLESEIVDYVEQDQMMYASQALSTQTLGTLATGLWGINRIWQRTRSVTTQYQYWTTAGSGVDAYVVDTGLYAAHSEFTGRTATGQSFVSDPSYPGTADGNGHGTHVSSTTAGTTYGVAKLATLIPSKVLSSAGSGSNAGVISGVEFVSTNARSRARPSVANMSLGGGASAALDTAVNNAVTGGVTFAVAAGNENQDSCNVSPARAANAITVGATTSTDARSSFSNFGTCNTIFAPGSSILGAWIGSTTATNTISGTSMASPHVAGAAALYLGQAPSATPTAVRSYLINSATLNAVTSPGTGSANRLLYTLAAI